MESLKTNSQNPQKSQKEQNFKTAKKGIIIFCIIHFLFEILTGNSGYALSVFINYFISKEYIKQKIGKNKLNNNFFISGFTVSGVVFLIRILIGLLAIYFLK